MLLEIKLAIKTLTIRKIVNYIKLNFSYLLYFYLGNKKIKGLPAFIAIETSNICNLNCLQCPTGQDILTRTKGKLNSENYKKIINQTYKNLLALTLYFQGEPFIDDNIYELIKYATDKNIFTLTSTNGHYLSIENSNKIIDSNLHKLIISLDGVTQEVYEKYRVGGDLQRVIYGIKNLVEAKQKRKSQIPVVELQFIVFKHNQHQIEDFKKLAKQLKVDKYKIKTAQIYDVNNNANLLTDIEKYSRYKKDENGNIVIKNKLKNRCKRMWTSPVITWQGDVVPCCFDKDAKYKMGNAFEQNFYSLWKDKKYYNFRNSIKTNRAKIDICKNCTE